MATGGSNMVKSGSGKVAWVTGASSGIGRALVVALAARGYRVAASARGAQALEELSRTVPGVLPFAVDITDRDAVAQTVRAIRAAMGPISLSILCAGTYQRDEPGRFDSAALRSMVDLNIMGTAHCLEALLPDMLAAGDGRIAVVSSVSGYTGLPGAAFYGATKAALINMCEAMVPELREKGVALHVVAPGFVKTPLTDLNDFPMPFMVTAEEAAQAILAGLDRDRFLISFPWKMALALRILSRLPYPIRFALTRRMLRRDEAKPTAG